MTQLYTATQVVDYMAQNHGVTMYKQTIWEVCRRHGIEPKPTGSKRRLGITRDELERLPQVYRPRVWSSASTPQRAPHKPGPGIIIKADPSGNRPRLAPRLEHVKLAARRAMLAHRAAVFEMVARTGISAREASDLLRDF
jgi:hypothetical protein